ncbi:uncharacterized protein LOC124616646 [Schistocerca americana]|uniref:uncharacterized protein LOC124616646 n=1 Tax=Schistocerca americana TaxID=7009 RepID=UPI001F4F25C8|nr:uncharacterized protein LOC124616646 [Schistocerca americana]
MGRSVVATVVRQAVTQAGEAEVVVVWWVRMGEKVVSVGDNDRSRRRRRRRSQRPYSRQDWRIAQYIKGGRRGSATVDSERPQQKSRRAEQQQTAAGNAGADQSDDMRLTTVFLLVALVMAACLTQMAYGNHEKSGGGGGGHDHGKGHSDGDGHGHDGR